MADSANVYRRAERAARLTFVLNLLLCLTKLVVGWLGGSFALLVDGINNLTDVGVSTVLFVGMHVARRPPDRRYAYGYGKFEQEVSRIISIIVLVTGGVIIWEAVKRLGDLHKSPDASVLVVAVVAILIKIFMYRYQNRMARQLSSSALAADALNHKSDVAATSCVLIGTAAIWMGGNAWASADDVAAIAVGVLMIVAAGQAIHRASSELLDEMPPAEVIEQIRALAESYPGIAGVDQILGRKTGMHYLIDIHLEVPGEMSVKQAHYLGHQVKDWIMAEISEISDIIVHVEPVAPASV